MREIIFQTIITAIAGAIAGALGYIGLKIKGYVEEKYNIHIKKETVETCVKAVEQLYHDLQGPEKLERCKTYVMQILAQKGIEITELELDMIIEAAVAQLNFKKLWGGDTDGNAQE